MNLDDDTYTAAGLTETTPSKFDKMTDVLFSRTLDFINKQYKLAFEKSKRSGNHRDFSCYCSETPWVLLYHKNLIETGDSTLQDLVVAELSDDVKRGFVGDSPERKRKTSCDRTVSSSVTSRTILSQQFALDRFVDLTRERYADSATLNKLKAKRIDLQTKQLGMQTEENALSLYSKYSDMLTRERKRFKILQLEDDYKSDGSEAIEIRNTIALCRGRMKVATASISLIGTEVNFENAEKDSEMLESLSHPYNISPTAKNKISIADNIDIPEKKSNTLELSTGENEINVEDVIRNDESKHEILKSSSQPCSISSKTEKIINIKDNIENLETNSGILETNSLSYICSTSPAANTRAKVVMYKEL